LGSGILTRIKYPTGGYTDFEFENHKFLTFTDYEGNYILDPQNRVPANAAGFRIKTITNYTSEGTVANKNVSGMAKHIAKHILPMITMQ